MIVSGALLIFCRINLSIALFFFFLFLCFFFGLLAVGLCSFSIVMINKMLLNDDDDDLDWQLQVCGVLDFYGCHWVAETEKVLCRNKQLHLSL